MYFHYDAKKKVVGFVILCLIGLDRVGSGWGPCFCRAGARRLTLVLPKRGLIDCVMTDEVLVGSIGFYRVFHRVGFLARSGF